MPTTITHMVPAVAIGLGLGRTYIKKRHIVLGAFIANIPDLDLIAPRFYGVSFDSVYGHRGFTHSIIFALLVAFLTSLFFIKKDYKTALLFFIFCALSHGILDACTQGGLGVTFLWPVSDYRFYSIFQPIMNVNTSFRGLYMTTMGIPIFISELIWVWIPFLLIGLALKFNFVSKVKEYFNR